MAYTVLARRYRSREFDEVIGQEPIARTLKRAIESDRVAHAYLFCGTRGIGKTSMARIFAKALNVTDDLEDREGIAEAIMRGDDMDVIEIDGASNRGVEEARDLISRSIYRPARCRFKIYIIDEVHMLTMQAFNTLLKTMEEPPAHVKFILCTTEPHKVPATIQSRCQRFDFRNIPTALIAAHLHEVLKGEKVKADDAAVMSVAKLADGSMRDGLSLLDRLIAANDKKLTVGVIEEMLGLPDQSVIDSLIGSIADGDAGQVLTGADELMSRGHSLDQVIEVLIERLRMMMIVRACVGDGKGNARGAVDLSDDDIAEVKGLAERFDLPAIVHGIVLLENIEYRVKLSATGRALFEAALVRLALAEKFADVAALLQGGGGKLLASTSSGGGGGQKKKVAVRHDVVIEAKQAGRNDDEEVRVRDEQGEGAGSSGDDGDVLSSSDLYGRLVKRAESSPALEALLEHLSIESIGSGVAHLVLDDATQSVNTKNNLDWLTKLVGEEVGGPMRIELRTVGSDRGLAGSKNNKAFADDRLTKEDREAVMKMPLVKRAMEVLEMRLIAVEGSS